MTHLILALLAATPAPSALPEPGQDPEDVPVTIKELDVEDAIREFQQFKERLGQYREEISAGRAVAAETAQILEELRSTAGPENDYNEEEILQAVSSYVDEVLGKQVDLVDFLESQRYRITYYANKMASSVRAEDLAVLFGSAEQNEAAISARVESVDAAQRAIADFVDGLPPGVVDTDTFRPSRTMSRETRRQLDLLLYRYQEQRNALELSKKRLAMVRAAQRNAGGAGGPELDIDADLLIGQMFGALDRIRLQMSIDLMYLEQMLAGYSHSSRTQEILLAFQTLVEMQGDLEGPSPELSSVLDWLQDSSTRRISISAAELERPGLAFPRYSDLLREAYTGARGGDR